MVSYKWSIETTRLPRTVAAILHVKHLATPSYHQWSPFLEVRGQIMGESILQICAYSSLLGAINRHYWCSCLLIVVLEPFHWKCITGVKIGQNKERGDWIITLNKLDLTFRAPNHCAKFHQNQIKIAAIEACTDASDFIIYPMLCYSNGTERNDKKLYRAEAQKLLQSKDGSHT